MVLYKELYPLSVNYILHKTNNDYFRFWMIAKFIISNIYIYTHIKASFIKDEGTLLVYYF